MLGGVITQVILSWFQIKINWSCFILCQIQYNRISIALDVLCFIALLEIPTAVEFST